MNVDPYKSHMNYYRDLVSRHNSIKISEIIPPYEGMIYHYTSVNAFCSILESSKLRFTNKKYLNDTTEGSYIFDLCKREAESLCRKRAEAKEQFLTLCDKIKREKARYNILEAYQIMQNRIQQKRGAAETAPLAIFVEYEGIFQAQTHLANAYPALEPFYISPFPQRP